MNKVKIIYEDEDLLVVDKPAHLIVNRSETTKDETLQDIVEKQIKLEDDGSDFYKRSGIVHRLDKETSGLLIVAKNREAFENLQSQFKERVVKKNYVALVHGILSGTGEINVPVERLPWNRKRFGVLAGGRPSVTKYKKIGAIKIEREDLTLLEVYPETGRTHQIRVHLKYLGHPIFADYIYGGRKVSRNDRKILDRVFLHAEKISFRHPKSGELLSFESKLPEQLEAVLKGR